MCVLSHLIGLLVPGNHAYSLDEGVTRVVHASLDGLVQCVAIGRGPVAQLGVHGGRQVTSHAVVVLAQVWVLSAVQTYNSNRDAGKDKWISSSWSKTLLLSVEYDKIHKVERQISCAFGLTRGS